MERFVDVDWNDSKSEILSKDPRRRLTLKEVSEILTKQHIEKKKSDNPLQILATGIAQGRLMSLAYEIRETDEGNTYYWLITYWPATTTERKQYEKEIHNY